MGKADELLASFPIPIEPPCTVDGSDGPIPLWSGEAKLAQNTKTIDGSAEVVLQVRPRPNFRFTVQYAPECRSELTVGFLKKWFSGDGIEPGELDCGPPFGKINVIPDSLGTAISGILGKPTTTEAGSFDSARFLVVNGPKHHGTSIRKEGGAHRGRFQINLGDARITIDRFSSDSPNELFGFAFTHVAEIRFDVAQPVDRFTDFASVIFRVLSLMRGRWVGLIGPWLYAGDSLTRIVPETTKSSSHGNSFQCCPNNLSPVFEMLAECFWNAQQDQEFDTVIQTAVHWLIETNLCAGAVEGSIVLQQAALESLAWFEIVQRRKLCSVAGFDRLPAADKIRWFLSLFSIPTSVPTHNSDLCNYLKEHSEVTDLPGILVDVRNAIVHGSPNKVKRIFERERGDSERTQLWYIVGGLLEQAMLAAIGYRGKIVRRDLEGRFARDKTRQVPWAPEPPTKPEPATT